LLDEQGIVCEIKDGHIKLLMKSSESCNGCTACSVDGGPQSRVLTINEKPDCDLGDIVHVGIHPASPYIGIFTLFVLPLILILVFYAFSNKFFPATLPYRDIATVVSAIIGLILSFPLIKIIDRFLSKHEKNLIKIKKVEKRSTQ